MNFISSSTLSPLNRSGSCTSKETKNKKGAELQRSSRLRFILLSLSIRQGPNIRPFVFAATSTVFGRESPETLTSSLCRWTFPASCLPCTKAAVLSMPASLRGRNAPATIIYTVALCNTLLASIAPNTLCWLYRWYWNLPVYRGRWMAGFLLLYWSFSHPERFFANV